MMTTPATDPDVARQTLERTSRRSVAYHNPVRLPAWPFTCLFALFPIWWVLGLADVITIVVAVVMVLYLCVRPGVRVPRGFLVWVGFLAFMLCSVSQLSRSISLITFGYRALVYLASTVVLVYLYNARAALPERRVLRQLTGYWITVVAGGVLGLIDPTGRFHTPMFYLVRGAAPGLLSNSLVSTMLTRPLAQYDPTGFYQVPARPSAPFLYTNNWGNVYSLLLPLVLVVMLRMRRGSTGRRLVTLLVLASAVPALLTLNRGMFLGLVLILLLIVARRAAARDLRPVALLAGAAVVVAILYTLLPIRAGLDSRVEASTSTRASLYQQSLSALSSSPLLGHGVPVDSNNPLVPAVGTQGQVWMLLVSHGLPATLFFMLFFLVAVWRTRRQRDLTGIVLNSALLVAVIELFYYGVLPYGLPLMMTIAALLLRRGDPAGERSAPVAT